MFYPFFTNPVSIIQHRCRPSQCLLHVFGGLSAPPAAGRRSQVVSDSNAASRQQTQKNNIASSDPRLVKNAPVGGRFFANCDRPPANCVHFMNLSRRNAASESERKAVVRGSWLVKAYHYTRMGCDRISQRAAQGSLYRGAGRQRRSERLKGGPYSSAMGRVFL